MSIIKSAQTLRPHSTVKSLIDRLIHESTRTEAGEEFFRRFDPWLRHLVSNILYRRSNRCMRWERDDLVQAVYLRLFEHQGRALHSFCGVTDTDFRAYLSVILYNIIRDRDRVALSMLRSGAPLPFPEQGSNIEKKALWKPPDQERRMQSRELHAQVRAGLRRLGRTAKARRDTWVFLMRHYEVYSTQEVADRLHIKPGYVHTICHRILKKLKVELASASS